MAKLSARWAAIYFAGYSLTGKSRSFDSVIEYAELDWTAFQDGVKNSAPGLPVGSVSVEAFLDPATNESHDAFKGQVGSYTDKHLLLLCGQNTTPTIGDPALLMAVKEFTYNPSIATAASVLANVQFMGQTEPFWGVCLANTTITNTTNFSSVDQSSSSSDGAEAILQVLTPTSTDSYATKVQDSADDSVWADLITFSADAQTRTSERGTVSGSVDQYVRAQAARTGAAGDDFKLAVGFARY